jgi:hypothetical protein
LPALIKATFLIECGLFLLVPFLIVTFCRSAVSYATEMRLASQLGEKK